MYGANWVDLMRSHHPEFHFVNCGVNGEVLESIRRRVQPTLKHYGDDIVGVVVLGGTNDVLANLNPSTRNLIRCYNPFLKVSTAPFWPLSIEVISCNELSMAHHEHTYTTTRNCPLWKATLRQWRIYSK